VKSRVRRMLEALERKKHEHEIERDVRGTLDNLIDEDEMTKQEVETSFQNNRKQIVEEAIAWLNDWELDFTDENILKSLSYIIWGDEDGK